jgi:hypothetical protein
MSIFRTDRLAHPTLAWIFPLAMLVGSCSAEAGRMTPPTSAGAGPTTSTPVVDPSVDPTSPLAPPATASTAAAQGGLRLLTESQYRNSIADLLGAVIVPTLPRDLPLSGFASVGAAAVSLSPASVELYDTAARDIARQALSDPERRQGLLGCTPTGPADRACAEAFLSTFMHKAWRGPVDASSLQRYVDKALEIAAADADFFSGIRWALAGVLSSPRFLYRAELGQGARVGARAAFSPWEMAGRLSYTIWNTTPDAALLAAAEAGALSTSLGLREQGTRLLGSPRAQEGLANFAREWFSTDAVSEVAKDAVLFPQLTPALRASMQAELPRLFADHTLARDLDALGVYTTPNTFIDAELATHYGLPAAGQQFSPVTLPADQARTGLLGTAAFLILRGKQHETSPTLRGKFIRTALLCQAVPPPPEGVTPALPEPPTDRPYSRRELLEQHSTDPACAGCHQLIDPLGYALEAFDPIGRFREDDRGLPLDTRGSIEGVAFEGLRGLATVLSEHELAKSCFVRNFYRYAMGQAETPAEARIIEQLVTSFDSQGKKLRELVLDVAESDAFRFSTYVAQGQP